jgi:FkbM family methyltransferase
MDRLTEVVDVGAYPIDGDPPYKSMLAAGLCRVTGFEPQEDALARLNAKKGPNERYLPYAIGDGERHRLRICRAPGMTSLLEPDPTMLALFDVLRPLGAVVREVDVETRHLDDLDEICGLDFLKIDVQGSELAVFRGGRAKLAQTVAIQVEVSFITLYKDQPALGHIDLELRAQGFVPHCFAAIKKWPIYPCVVNGNPRQPLNQLLEADLVYVRNFADPSGLSDDQIKHLTLIAHTCYGSFDLAIRCVMVLERRGALPGGAQRRYLDLLSAGRSQIADWSLGGGRRLDEVILGSTLPMTARSKAR